MNAVGAESRFAGPAALLVGFALTVAIPPLAATQTGPLALRRPFLMPAAERARILELVATEAWAQREMARLQRESAKDGYSAALLYALTGGEQPLAVARRWLLEYGAAGGDVPMAKEKLHDEAFFRGGQPWIGPVYYNTDIRPLVAYDWVHSGLTPGERAAVEEGILTSARFRRRCMNRWSQTANLVFKPTFMVALAGLVTQDRELLAWGFLRRPGSPTGGYFPVLDTMLDAGGPWREAPIYPVAHKTLALMATMSRLLAHQDPANPFARPSASGGSPQALMDYYLDSAYPPETGPDGGRRIRVLTYGDGATSSGGDLFLAGAGKGDLSLGEALAESWSASRDARYAAFLALDDTYRPTLHDRPPLPTELSMPAAPSRVWKSFGLAFLRSEEGPEYWQSERAMAASLMMSRGYGHDHRDKLGITFFGAGRLLYPDWNHEQYENPAVGWTRNTIAHNTLMVDEEDARDAEMTDVRSDFSPEAKRVAVTAEGIFEGVRQTRSLVLTRRYLLDVVSARSGWPRTYDWLLHVLGKPAPGREGSFAAAPPLGPRFSRMRQEPAGETDGAWGQSFVAGDGGVRVTMAETPGTRVVTGIGHDGNAMLVARRERVKATEFVAVHEPLRAGEAPGVRRVSIVERSAGSLLVRVAGDGWAEEHRVPVATESPAAAADAAGVEMTSRDVRLSPRDSRPLELTVVNRSSSPLRGTIHFEIPPGVTLEPNILPVGPVPPGGEARVVASISTVDPAPGRLTLVARLQTAEGGRATAEAGVALWIGPTLRSDYRSSASPLYRVEAPRLRAGLDMRDGTVRHLTDDEGRDRLAGRALFSFAAAGKPLLSEQTVESFTWPTAVPASLLAEVENAARFRIRFAADRLSVGMDRDWTRAERVAFTIPGRWAAGGVPHWADVADQAGKIAGAELAFPDGSWSLCFGFAPPQIVVFDGAGLGFEVGGANGEEWSAGFCRRESLLDWLRRDPPPGSP